MSALNGIPGSHKYLIVILSDQFSAFDILYIFSLILGF